MIEHCADGTDLYSEFGAVARTARVKLLSFLSSPNLK